MKLIKADNIKEEEYNTYIEEWTLHKERVIPYSSSPRDMSFDDLHQSWLDEPTPLAYQKNFVPSQLYFLMDEEVILGALHLRFELNEHLKAIGGHIGYGVKPSERKKGYVTKMMALIMSEANSYGIDRLLLTCDEDNIASAKAIEKCGGILEGHFMFEDKPIRKYWIGVKND